MSHSLDSATLAGLSHLLGLLHNPQLFEFAIGWVVTLAKVGFSEPALFRSTTLF